MFKTVKKFGFTMIELLIVIAVLGILAVAVLAAINPIEQINRGRDTGSRSDAEQLLSAIDRFYASQGYYPWRTGADDVEEGDGSAPLGDGSAFVDATLADLVDTASESVLDKLTEGGTAELKTSFVTRIVDPSYNTLKVYNRGTQGDSTYICFVPKSGAFAEEAKTRCGGTGGDFGQDLPEDLAGMVGEVCVGEDSALNMVCLP